MVITRYNLEKNMNSSAPGWLIGLNERQCSAVTAPLRNMLILAGAGSGKTRVFVSRMACLIEQHAFSPEAILAVTFTNKAANEMKTRLHRLLSCSKHGLWVGTFHGLCHRLLRQHYTEARLPDCFQIMDADDQVRMLKRVILSLHLDIEQWPAKQALRFINNNKDEGLRPNHVSVQSYGPSRTYLAIYSAYEQACQLAGVIDFSEILLRCHEMLRDNSALLAYYQQRFQAILVDEFQDTNAVQYAWIRLLAGTETSVMVVGDDDQSIYGWRGAKIENIQRFSQDFAYTEVIRLEQNYRSTSRILQASNALITHNTTRMGKALWTDGALGEKIRVYGASNELHEARFVKEGIVMAQAEGCSLNEIAILYRSNAQSRVLEEALLHAGIAYRIHGGLRFFERAEIKDAMAYLRLIVNPADDTAFERIVNFPTRGVGEKTLDEMRVHARARECSLWDAATQLLASSVLPTRAATALYNFMKIIKNLQEKIAVMDLDVFLQEVMDNTGLIAYFSALKGEQATSKSENLQELIHASREFRLSDAQSENSLSLILVAFLSHTSLEGGEQQAEVLEQYVHLMTLHAAKGLEFSCVFLVGMEEGLFPSKQALDEPGRLEEERRLCYVGMTRAKEQLVIVYAKIRRQYGREE